MLKRNENEITGFRFIGCIIQSWLPDQNFIDSNLVLQQSIKILWNCGSVQLRLFRLKFCQMIDISSVRRNATTGISLFPAFLLYTSETTLSFFRSSERVESVLRLSPVRTFTQV